MKKESGPSEEYWNFGRVRRQFFTAEEKKGPFVTPKWQIALGLMTKRW
jgi:hypothetical protein